MHNGIPCACKEYEEGMLLLSLQNTGRRVERKPLTLMPPTKQPLTINIILNCWQVRKANMARITTETNSERILLQLLSPDVLPALLNINMSNGGYADQNARESYFGRITSDFSQKYLIELLMRYDGSYMFRARENTIRILPRSIGRMACF